MPQPVPQPPGPEPKPSQPPADTPHSGPDTATPGPAEEGAVFRALVDAGAEAMVAYTAEKQMHAMTSETVAAHVQPLVTELRQLRENMATKADLAGFAAKSDFAGFATKTDFAGLATKADLAGLETRMTKWMFGALTAQAALIIAIIKLLG